MRTTSETGAMELAAHKLALTYYGDDLTGSTDTMESLSANGLPTVLFLHAAPDPEELQGFEEYPVVGVAGVSRSHTPAWMDQHLPEVFEKLKALGAPICHYKVCSTFDSSPVVGSIGRAMDIGQRIFGNSWVPLVVGAPILKRYTLFGNLFATVDGVTYRIDRHPTMKCHPVTPMQESDLRLHLGLQTNKRIDLLDILALQSPALDERFQTLLDTSPEVVLFDILDEASLREVGRLMWRRRPAAQTFVVGSSGLDYALVAYWQSTGELIKPAPAPEPGAVDVIPVISGSCSPTTERQIRWALNHGFAGVPVDAMALGASGDAAGVCEDAVQHALEALSAGRSPLLHTAMGPASVTSTGLEGEEGTEFHSRLGQHLGLMLREILQRTGLQRAMVCGGDTSGHAAQQLGIKALTMIRPLAPGGPLCRAWSQQPEFDGLEIVFKGGQVGSDAYFGWVRQGRPD
jgi:3-oxoisoapionate kinase